MYTLQQTLAMMYATISMVIKCCDFEILEVHTNKAQNKNILRMIMKFNHGPRYMDEGLYLLVNAQ